MVELNCCQKTALSEIIKAFERGETRHVLTGHAGTGKTTLMQAVIGALDDKGISVAATAPTNKAVAVLGGKLAEAGLGRIETLTIYSLLGLRPSFAGEGKAIKRSSKSRAAQFRAVVIDECSMVGTDLYDYIANDLRSHFVLFVGDPAQLPPVGEESSQCFDIHGKSHLSKIVRQAEDNPILLAAQMLRDDQRLGVVRWEWAKAAEAGPIGVYHAGDDADEWMRDAFTSDEFKVDNDAFRYLCWTNAKVAQVNAKVRRWVYGGETPTPFVPGERVICRCPILNKAGSPALSTNEEATVRSISSGVLELQFPEHPGIDPKHQALPAWRVELPVWEVTLDARPSPVDCVIARCQEQMAGILSRLRQEARRNPARWYERYQLSEAVAMLQAVYAMTCHTAQGSTFQNVFIDVSDIRKAEMSRRLEMQQMLYVAVTRASRSVVLVGAP